jgi:signal transduction histidine kinase
MAPSPAPAHKPSAAAATLKRLKSEGPRTLLVLVSLCLGIAIFLTVLDGRGFWPKLVYSLSIGVVCTVIVDLTRIALAWLTDTARRARGMPAQEGTGFTGWAGAIPGSLLAIVLGPPAGMWLGDQFTGYTSPSLLSFGPSARITLIITVIATTITVVVISTLERLSAARAQAEAAQRQAAENQLRLLQSQLEPHMLFNTLANLRVLIGLDPQRAQAMLDRLIGFLRATLTASRQDQHALAAEFRHTDDYLALMAVRMGPRLSVKLHLPDELATLPLPPLLLQPLVENAIKHGLEPKVEGGRLDVSARREGRQLVLQVRDTGVGLGAAGGAGGAAGGTGFGLEQVRTRLATLYGARAALTLSPAVDAEGGALATITLPLD